MTAAPRHYHEPPREQALTKEQVMAARQRDARPKADLPAVTRLVRQDGSLRVAVLASGSKGNCVVISGPEGALMVDCGLSRKETLARMELCGIDPATIQGVILTHEHTDHCSGIVPVSRKLGCPVYGTTRTFLMRKVLTELEARCDITRGDELTVGGLTVNTFPLSHDVADPIGVRVSYGPDSVAILTDSGVILPAAWEMLENVQVLALETNHDPEMLKTGPYPYPLKRRIASDLGHLSNVQSADALEGLLSNELECVVGMHISQNNNLPEKAREALHKVLLDNGHPAQLGIANQVRPLVVE